MDEKRKAWCEKYKVNIPDGGFIDKYCMPKHVQCVLSTEGGSYYIGFDGTRKTYSQLTEEEKQDYLEQLDKQDIGQEISELISKLQNRKNHREER